MEYLPLCHSKLFYIKNFTYKDKLTDNLKIYTMFIVIMCL